MGNKYNEILTKLEAELDPDQEFYDDDFDSGYELGIKRAIYIVNEVIGYDTRESSEDS